jgi:hypothetical protein
MKVLICLKVLLEGPTINLSPVAFKMLITKHTERTEIRLQIPYHVIKLAAALGVHSIHQLVRRDYDLVEKSLVDPTFEVLLQLARLEMVLQLGCMKLLNMKIHWLAAPARMCIEHVRYELAEC